jgi:deoxycytidylate deaminase
MAETIRTRPELFFGFVGPLGLDLKLTISFLQESLNDFNYRTKEITLIRLLEQINGYENINVKDDYFERCNKLIDRGNDFRKRLKSKDALALLAIGNIGDLRKENNISLEENKSVTPLWNIAYLFRSFKTPEEVILFKKIYNSSFYLISVYSSISNRKKYLTKRIRDSRGTFKGKDVAPEVEHLILRDSKEEDAFGQNITDTFPLADLFIDIDNKEKAKNEINRFVELIFGFSLDTPSNKEYAMFHAKAAALRSGSLARQVGAVITDDKNEIISLGTNEVPKSFGGQYWNGDENDARDGKMGSDISDELKIKAIEDILLRLDKIGALKKRKENIKDYIDKLLFKSETNIIKKCQIMNIIEFARAVHAETGALINAARRGVKVQDCNMFVTTFPCHDCAKHIVDAGIRKVYYIEPYPKSLVDELFSDSIQMEQEMQNEKKVVFEPFVGILPNKYINLFTMQKRKDKKGRLIEKNKFECEPIENESHWGYIPKEIDIIKNLEEYLEIANLIIKEEE